MSVGAALASHLKADPGVSAIVEDRVHLVRVPSNNKFPRIVMESMSGDPTHHMGGASGLADVLYQIDCQAKTYTSADRCAEAVRLALDTYPRGTLGIGDNAVTVEGVSSATPQDTHDSPIDGGSDGVFTKRILATVWFREAVPSFS